MVLAIARFLKELLIKETILIQEQQPTINMDQSSIPLFIFNT